MRTKIFSAIGIMLSVLLSCSLTALAADTTAPTSLVEDPVEGAVISGYSYTVTGTASDVYNEEPLFGPMVNYDVSTFTTSYVSSADLNGDGILDLVSANLAYDSLSVLLGNGDGTFGAKTEYNMTTGVMPRAVIAVDLDGDGALDLVSANEGGGTRNLSVLMGNGDGTFGPATYYSAGTLQHHVTSADLNRDGRPDIISAGVTGKLSVMLGQGGAEFSLGPRTDFAAGSDCDYVTCADLDRDGILDLVAADFGSSNLSVLIGNGDGTFGTMAAYASGDSPSSVECADLNRDGILDLVSANTGSGNISVLLGNGDGTFGTKTDYTTGANAETAACADLNRDGILDLVSANMLDNNISVLLGNGDGTFGACTNFPTDMYPETAICADLDADGNIDIVTANWAGTLSVHLGIRNGITKLEVSTDGGLNWSEEIGPLNLGPESDFAAGVDCDYVTCADLDRDGILDLVAADFGSSNLSVLLGNGDGTFGTMAAYASGDSPSSVECADLNRDGILDLVSANTGSGNISVLLGNGDGTFGTKTDYTTGANAETAACADLNRDGILDLVSANMLDNNISVLLGNGDGTFGACTNFSTDTYPETVICADLDSDGNIDIVTSNWAGTLSVLLGNGDGTFGPMVNYDVSIFTASYVSSADLNGDGILDLVSANLAYDSLSVLLGNGDGTFGAKTEYNMTTGVMPRAVIAVDLDGDGALDLVSANEGGGTRNLSVLMGNGDGTFGPVTYYSAGTLQHHVTSADLNRDGRPDIISAGFTGKLSVMLGGLNFSNWSYDWKPLPADGQYNIISRATDGAGNTEIPYTGPTVTVDNDAPTSTITDPAYGASIYGTSYTITGTADDGNGSGVQRVEVSFDNGQNWYSATGTSNWSYEWMLPSDGQYEIYARAKDNAGHVQTSPAGIGITVANTITLLYLNPSVTPDAYNGMDVTFTTAAAGRSGSFEYQFLRRGPDLSGPEPGGYSVVQDWSPSNTWDWTDIPYASVGANYIAVRVRETGQTAPANYTYIQYIVHESNVTLDIYTADPPDSTDFDTSVTFTATASGGSGNYEFQFQRTGPDTGGNFVIIQTWTSANTCDWIPDVSTVGFNTVTCQVRKAGTTDPSDYDWIIYEITAPPITIDSFTSDPAGEQLSTGSPASFTATVSGGTGSYEYQFQRRGPDTENIYIVVQPWGPSDMLNWTPAEGQEGNNYIVVQVRRTGGGASEAYDWMMKEVVP